MRKDALLRPLFRKEEQKERRDTKEVLDGEKLKERVKESQDWTETKEETYKQRRKRRDEEDKNKMEELRRHLVHRPTGPQAVFRVRTLYAWVSEDETELSFEAGAIISGVWPTPSNKLLIVVT